MDEMHRYEAILETYKKQETPLKEKDQDLDKSVTEHQNVVKRLEKIRKEVEENKLKLQKKRLKLNESMQYISSICEETVLTWKNQREKQKKIFASKTRMNNTLEDEIGTAQEVCEKLKQLDTELQFGNVSKKYEDYQNKIQKVSEIVDKRNQEDTNLNTCVRITAYQICSQVKEKYKRVNVSKSLLQINEEIKRIKESINAINKKAKEEKQK